MSSASRRSGRPVPSAVLLLGALALASLATPAAAPAQPARPTPAAPAAPATVALRAATAAERAGFHAAVDGLWIPFGARAAALDDLDRLVLDDVAAVLLANPALRVRLWATAPDATDLAGDTLGRPAGSSTPLAGARRAVVRDHLAARGVGAAQLGELAGEPAARPAAVRWRTVGGAFLFLEDAGDAGAAALFVPASHARVRVRARPGTEIFLVPRAFADRDSALACAPPLVTRLELVGADSVIERPYPPRPVLTVARDASGVIVTRRHDVDARRDPDLIDLLAALPDPRCRR